jgi:hypothetical protein
LRSGENLRKNSRIKAAIELWKAKVPLSDIRKQLKMSESTLRSSGGWQSWRFGCRGQGSDMHFLQNLVTPHQDAGGPQLQQEYDYVHPKSN